MEKVVVRKAVPTDYPFIYATFLKNNWFSPKNDTVLKKDTWFRIQHQRLEKILDTGQVSVACLSNDSDVILGYSIKDMSDKPFTYLRPQWRNVGIEELLK